MPTVVADKVAFMFTVWLVPFHVLLSLSSRFCQFCLLRLNPGVHILGHLIPGGSKRLLWVSGRSWHRFPCTFFCSGRTTAGPGCHLHQLLRLDTGQDIPKTTIPSQTLHATEIFLRHSSFIQKQGKAAG